MSRRPAAPGSRPRNRKELILLAAGRAFAAGGYPGTSMEDIARAVGITAAALYRHVPSKYELFRQCTEVMVGSLAETLAEQEADADLGQVLLALARTTVADRATGSLYRWEARYLDADDRASLRARFAEVVEGVDAHVGRAAPEPAASRSSRTAAALGAIGSVTVHRTSLAARRLERLVTEAALRAATADVDLHGDDPGGAGSGGAAVAVASVASVLAPGSGRREQILAAAVPLFHREGFAQVTMSRIAADVGLTPSALYRHFDGKTEILAAACLQAADSLQAAVQARVDVDTAPRLALAGLAEAYVDHAFACTALTAVAEAEVLGLPEELRRPVVQVQRDHVGLWTDQLRRHRPELEVREARVLVHAALGVVVEVGRHLHWQDSPGHRRMTRELMLRALDA